MRGYYPQAENDSTVSGGCRAPNVPGMKIAARVPVAANLFLALQ
jgi:hypothetical protein